MEDDVIDGGKERTRSANTVSWRTSGPTRRTTKGNWTPEEDALLFEAVNKHKRKSWNCIAAHVKDRTGIQCLHRWQMVLNPEIVKGAWTKEEDALITSLVEKYGSTKWSAIARSLPGRIGKQCRERSDNSIKNRWNCSLKKKKFAEEILNKKSEMTNLDLNIYGQETEHKESTLEKQEQAGDYHFPTTLDVGLVNPVKCSTRKRLFLESVTTKNCVLQLSNRTSVGECHKVNFSKQDDRSHDHRCSEVGVVNQNSNMKSTIREDHKLAHLNHSNDPSVHWNRCSLCSSPHEKWVCISSETCSSIRNVPMPLMEENMTKSVLSEELSEPEEYNKHFYSPIQYFSPPLSLAYCSPCSPNSILRKAAESFETPSIISRYSRLASLDSFSAESHLEEPTGNISGERDNMFSIHRSDMLRAQKFPGLSRDYLKLGTSDTDEIVGRKLEAEFEVVWDRSSLN